jgi:hypothetical protein
MGVEGYTTIHEVTHKAKPVNVEWTADGFCVAYA